MYVVVCIVARHIKTHTDYMKKAKPPPTSLRAQHGSAVIEFLVAAVPVLLLGLGATETARWYIHKQHVRYALIEAQRVASVTHAKPEHMIEAFEEALNPLFAPSGRYDSIAARRDAYLSTVALKTAMPSWRMVITSPTPAHFKDFKQQGLNVEGANGLATINNNYQLEQHQEKGLGVHSQQSIYEANILSIDLVYAYKPLVPGVANLMRSLSSSSDSKLKQSYYEAGYLPLLLSSHIGMQSHPVQWPTQINSKVLWQDQVIVSDKTNTTGSVDYHDICAGLWCPDLMTNKTNNRPISNQSNKGNRPPQHSTDIGTKTPNNPTNNLIEPGTTTAETAKDAIIEDPNCGISLCC